MAVIIKFVLIVPKDISVVAGVHKMTLPTTPGFSAVELSHKYDLSDAYATGADNRQVWTIKGEETTLNDWITANSDMVIEKTFAETEALGQELEPQHDYTVHKVVKEDEKIISEEDVVKTTPVFNLQERLDDSGI